jgi:hypothetical protein
VAWSYNAKRTCCGRPSTNSPSRSDLWQSGLFNRIRSGVRCYPIGRPCNRFFFAECNFATRPALAPPPAPQGSFVASWLEMVSATQAAQPHWITPLVTVTPRLEQEVRYDYNITDQSNGSHVVNIGSGKGPEFIPTYDTEVSLGLPPVEQMTSAKGGVTHGYGDWPTMLLKYRFISANDQQGNYIVTGFIQASAPVGTNGFSNDVYVVQPTLAVGKGWGDFDIQSTLSQQYAVATVGPPGSLQNFGDPILSNTSFQYHLFEYFWPELEVSYTSRE